jgi:tetratricopeptide (TPR) repeat protein
MLPACAAPGGGLRRSPPRGADAAPLGIRPHARGPGDRGRRPTSRSWPTTGTRPRPAARADRVGGGSEDAEARYAFPEAQDQYERAIELWDQSPDAEARLGQDRIEILARLASVARFHDPHRAITTIQEAIRLVDREVDPTRAALLNERLGRYAWIAGEASSPSAPTRPPVNDIPADPPSAAAARALAGFAQILMLGARFEESREVADRALAMARLIGARDIEGHALNTRAMDRGIAGEIEPALADFEIALRIAEELDLVDDIGRVYANRQWVLDSANRLDDALAVAERGSRSPSAWA